MGFEMPTYLQSYLNTDWRKPLETFVNMSTYYTNLDTYFINYMSRVVRPCMAYANGVTDGINNSGVKLNVGMALKNTAVKLVKGDQVMFYGDDDATEFLSDIWASKSGFERFFEQAIDYMLSGGTAAAKLNIVDGRCIPVAFRADRYYADYDESGDVIAITFLSTLLSSQKVDGGTEAQYWLVEQRYYNESGDKCVKCKVHHKSGLAGQDVVPDIYAEGLPEDALTDSVKRLIKIKGIKLNEEMLLPFKDGLGVWIWQRTATNSCVPGIAAGDPLLFGTLDILWAIDTVFSGTIIDVIQGKGKILVPKRYLKQIQADLEKAGAKTVVGEFLSDYDTPDDSLVYIYTDRDKDFTPQSVQFDIRSAQYKEMLEIYLRQAAVTCGFAPTSIFPFLQDNAAKTATEITAEDNLTRATVQSIHRIILPVINRMVAEVLYIAGFNGQATVQLSDYIGNKLQHDANLRDNYAAGGIPQDVFVQQLNNISKRETDEYVARINEEQKQRQAQPFDGLDNLGLGL